MKIITEKKQKELKTDCDIVEASLEVIHKYLLYKTDIDAKDLDECGKALEAYNMAKFSLKSIRESLKQ